MTSFPPRRSVAVADLAGALTGAVLVGAPAEGARVADVTHDSREAGPGVLFACRPGATADGHDFAPRAVAAGAPALLVERVLALDVPQILVADVARWMGPAAAVVHGDPSAALTLLGVTGTSGKTTTAFLLESALAAAGHRTGLVGTVHTAIAGEVVPGLRTTPESTDLQRLLRRMVDRGVTGAAMEVSSHGLALGRVRGTRFAAVGFSNLSQDHLDFHRDMADYEAAKASLFDPAYTGVAAVNVDDPAGRRIAAVAQARGLDVVRVSAEGAGDADVTAAGTEVTVSGSTFRALLGAREVDVRLQLPGAFNVANGLLALATAVAGGVDADAAAAGLGALPGVPGRMEPVHAGQPFAVLVDYAHKPGALENVLATARGLTAGRVIVVVGCGGERDRGKRPVMGRVAAALADLAVFTDDNPRGEDPQAILDAMVQGAAAVPSARVTVEGDRRTAIALALEAARAGDVVVVAGKGHETYQEVGDRALPFDDRAVVRELLAQRAGHGAPTVSGGAR